MIEKGQPALYGTALLKGKEILDFILNYPQTPNLKEISDHLNISKPTILKILKTLEYCGFVKRAGEEKRYYLGTIFLSYASKVNASFDIHLIAEPYLEQLRTETDETVNLGILDSNRVILLAKLESPQSVKLVSQVGGNMHLYSSAMGKAMLATYSQEQLDNYLNQVELQPLTSNTITDKTILRQNIKKVARQGYAVDDNENQPDIYCIGFSLYKDHKIYGAFSVSAPKYRVNARQRNDFIKYGKTVQAKILAAI